MKGKYERFQKPAPVQIYRKTPEKGLREKKSWKKVFKYPIFFTEDYKSMNSKH